MFAVPALMGPAEAGPVLENGRALPLLPEGYRPAAAGSPLDGDWVYAGIRPYPGDTGAPLTIYRTASDGSGSWATVTDPATGQPMTSVEMPQVQNGVILLRTAELEGGCTAYRVIAGSARTVNGCGIAPRLTGGGRVVRQVNTALRLEQADGTFIRTFDRAPYVEGDRAWYLNTSWQLVGVDLVTGDALPADPIPYNCTPTSLRGVEDGYALVSCGGVGVTAVVDVAGDLPPYPLGNSLWYPGKGFAARPLAVSGGTEINVVDLGQGKAERSFLAASISRPASDGSGRPQLAFITPAFQIAMADLGPLAPRNTSAEDTVAPTVSLDVQPASVVKPPAGAEAALLSYGWSGLDPGYQSTIRYDTRIADYYKSRPPQPLYDLDKGTTATTGGAYVDGSPLRVHCFQVRARDWAGNTSAWTEPVCTLVDGEAPYVQWYRIDKYPFHTALASQPLKLRWAGNDYDGSGLGTSTLSYRASLPGQTGVTWKTPAAWQSMTAHSAQKTFPAGSTVCFRAKMRDLVGNVGVAQNPSDPICYSVPFDDRDFATQGPATRGRSNLMLGGTYTRLNGSSAWLVRPNQRVRTLYLRVSGEDRIFPQVWVGGRRVDGSAYSTWTDGTRRWISFRFSETRVGTLKIRGSASNGPTVIDAIAVEH